MMESKKCQQCGTDFTPLNNRGEEQKYCTAKCRQTAQYERLKKRLYENKGEKTGTLQAIEGSHSGDTPKGTHDMGASLYVGSRTGQNETFEPRGVDLFALYVGSLQGASEARNEAYRHQLRAESLEREIAELRKELSELNAELSEIEEEEPQQEGIGKVVSGLSEALPGLTRAYKEEPKATINFVKDSIAGLFTA